MASSSTPPAVTPSRILRPWVERVAAVLEWSTVDKSLLGATVFLAFSAFYWLAMSYVLADESAAPYIDRAVVVVAYRIQSAILCAWLALIATCLVVRTRRPDTRIPSFVLLLLGATEILYGSYLLGLHTSPFFAVSFLASVATGYVWYERRPMNLFTAVVLGGAVLMALAEINQLIPSAPAFIEVPLRDGVLRVSYVVTLGGVTFVMLLALTCWVAFFVATFHERGLQLVRANDVISRYVASQLAQQIRAGNFEAFERHERRRFTLFFSDIEDFAETADHVEPEDLSEVLNEYLSEMAQIGERYGGTIDKFAGDAVMIIFGAPVGMDEREQAERAVGMAIDMQERLVTLRERWLASGFERPFRIRIGVNTGRASIGNFGSRQRADYTAIGRQVNLAARLQARCEPDKVLVSHSTWVLVRDTVECVSNGEIQVKGFRDLVKVYEVVGRRSSA